MTDTKTTTRYNFKWNLINKDLLNYDALDTGLHTKTMNKLTNINVKEFLNDSSFDELLIDITNYTPNFYRVNRECIKDVLEELNKEDMTIDELFNYLVEHHGWCEDEISNWNPTVSGVRINLS
mgnify:FL=1